MKCQHFILLRLVFGNVTMLTLLLSIPFWFYSILSIWHCGHVYLSSECFVIKILFFWYINFSIWHCGYSLPSFCAFRYSNKNTSFCCMNSTFDIVDNFTPPECFIIKLLFRCIQYLTLWSSTLQASRRASSGGTSWPLQTWRECSAWQAG